MLNQIESELGKKQKYQKKILSLDPYCQVIKE